jgi:hypothetical protein
MAIETIVNPTLADVRRIFKKFEDRLPVDKDFSARTVAGTSYHKQYSKNKILCYICQKPNHKAMDCWHNPVNKNKHPNKRDNTHHNPNNANQKTVVKLARDNIDLKEENSFKDLNVNTNHEVNDNNWIIDSGATTHITSDITCLENKIVNNKRITLADESFITSEAIGDVTIKNDHTHAIILKNVLYAPDLKDNLISVSKLTEDHTRVIFDENECKIYDHKDDVLLKAIRKNDFYIVDPILTDNTFALKTNLDNFKLWHCRLGHINNNYINMMLKNKMVHKLDLKPQNTSDHCDSCTLAKFSRKPFKPIGQTQSKHQLELLHIDLIGPINPESLGKSSYAMTIVDDFSRKIFVKTMPSKSDVPETLKDFIVHVENLTSLRVKNVRSDNGSEFVNRNLQHFFRSKGIHHQLTTFYSPAQNGVAEKTNRTLIEGTRALLFESQLPPQFWAEAMCCFTYIKNRAPCHMNNKLTPDELFSGKKNTVNYLKIFGCQAYHWIPDNKRKKT